MTFCELKVVCCRSGTKYGFFFDEPDGSLKIFIWKEEFMTWETS